MRVIGVDPASHVCGVAELLTDGPRVYLRRAALIKARADDCLIARMAELTAGLLDWVSAAYGATAHVVTEIPGGKVHGKRHRGGGAGLSIYGFAAGMIYARLAAIYPSETHVVTAEEWTRGIPKETRALRLAGEFANYKPEEDRGGDIADAIGVALWWVGEERRRAAAAGDRESKRARDRECSKR